MAVILQKSYGRIGFMEKFLLHIFLSLNFEISPVRWIYVASLQMTKVEF